MEIKFEENNYKFNVRSSCIIVDKNKERVLLSNMRAIKNHEAFILPGGRLDVLENSEQAIKREIEEELGISIDCKLVSVEENIDKENKFHMIEFVYYSENNDFSLIKTLYDGWDKFKIVNIDQIDNYDIRPKTIKEIIKRLDIINHNTNYDWGNENI